MHSSRCVPSAAVAVGRGVLHQAPPGPFPQGAGTTQGAGTSPGSRPPGPGTPLQQAPLTAGTPTPGADRYLYSAICNPWRPSQSTRDRSMLLQKDDGSVCIRAILPLTVLDTGGCEVCLREVMRSTCCTW